MTIAIVIIWLLIQVVSFLIPILGWLVMCYAIGRLVTMFLPTEEHRG